MAKKGSRPTPGSTVLLLFSGGLDSTATAIHYLLGRHRLLLVTFDNGAQRNLHLSKRRARAIIRRFPSCCKHQIFDCRDLFHQIVIKSLEKDIPRYGNLVCCGCKLAMLAKAILLCRDHHISVLADGYRKEQGYYPEQTKEFIAIADDLASKLGVHYQHPLYELSSEQIRELTLRGGLRFQAQQASCLFGENRMSEKGKAIALYTQEKRLLIEHWLGQQLHQKAQLRLSSDKRTKL